MLPGQGVAGSRLKKEAAPAEAEHRRYAMNPITDSDGRSSLDSNSQPPLPLYVSKWHNDNYASAALHVLEGLRHGDFIETDLRVLLILLENSLAANPPGAWTSAMTHQ